MSQVLSIHGYRQLFVDDHIVEAIENLEREMHVVDKHPANPVMVPENPWEHKSHYTWDGGTAMYDEAMGIFRIWHATAQTRVLYAESDDGVTWRKPNLGMMDYDGSKANNIMTWGTQPSVMKAPTGADLPGRYVMGTVDNLGFHSRLGRHPVPGDPQSFGTPWRDGSGYAVLFSDDGLHWEPHPENPVGKGGGDSGIMSYDPYGKRFVWVTKPDAYLGERTCPTCGEGYDAPRRVLTLSSSQDLTTWSPALRIFQEDEIDRQIVARRAPVTHQHQYVDVEGWMDLWLGKEVADEWREAALLAEKTDLLERVAIPPVPGYPRMDYYVMSVVPYEGLYLGFLQTLLITAPAPYFGARWTTKSPAENHGGQDGVMEVQLVVSRDLIKWERIGNREPFIPLGEVGSWDQGMTTTFHSPIRQGDELWIYYGGSNFSHSAEVTYDRRREFDQWQGVGLAKLRLDGWVSLNAGQEEGSVLTRPFMLQRNEIFVNVEAPDGTVVMEVSLEGGGPPLITRLQGVDAVRHVVPLVLKPFVGRIVQIRFRLKNAKLYSFGEVS